MTSCGYCSSVARFKDFGGAIDSIASFVEADLVPLRSGCVIEGLAGIIFGVFLSLGGPFGGGISDAHRLGMGLPNPSTLDVYLHCGDLVSRSNSKKEVGKFRASEGLTTSAKSLS